jgi:uncharacterized protein YfiM (DUF2279 family)
MLAIALPLRAQETDASTRCTGRSGTVTRAGVATAFVGANAALYAYFDQAWWSGEKSDFWVNWERGAPFRGQDKLGHLFGGYHLARMGNDLMQLGCVSPGRAAWLSAAYAAAFQLQIEVWDGTQKEYGFSPPDLVANTAGTALAWGQTRSSVLRAFKPTISYDRTDALRDAADGSELRTTVDYSGQTYWLSADMDALLGEDASAWWPGIVRLSLGHTITDWVDPATGRSQWAHRRILLSLDLDPEKLPGDHPLWNRIKHELSYYRFPAPAIQLYPSVKGIAWHK